MEPHEYEKIRILGNGSFGSAWLVKSKSEGSLFVSKEIPIWSMQPKDRNAAINELKILGTLRHKNIICYKDAFMHEKNMCILMEYADDGDLGVKIKQQSGRLFLELQIIDWFVQMLVAVKYIHSLHILHRDIKSQNVFLTKSGLVKVGDFGVSRMLDAQNALVEAEAVLGTPYYLSPEICLGKSYNHKTDMWSLGVVLYELTTLHCPFIAEDLSSLKLKIVNGGYTPISNCYGKLLKDLVLVLLNVEPEKRPSAAQLLKVPALQMHLQNYLIKVKHSDEPVMFKCQMENETTLTDIGRSTSGSDMTSLSRSSSDASPETKDTKEVPECRRSAKPSIPHCGRLSGENDLSGVSAKTNIPHSKDMAGQRNKPVKVDFIKRNKILATAPPERFIKVGRKSPPDTVPSKQNAKCSSPHRVFTRRVKSAPTLTCLGGSRPFEEMSNASVKKGAHCKTRSNEGKIPDASLKKDAQCKTRSNEGKIPVFAAKVKRRSVDCTTLNKHPMDGVVTENNKKDDVSTPCSDSTQTKQRSTDKKFKFINPLKRTRSSLHDNGDVGGAKKVTKKDHVLKDRNDASRKSPKHSVVICNEEIVKDKESDVITNHSAIGSQSVNKENEKPKFNGNTKLSPVKEELHPKKQPQLHFGVKSRISEQLRRQCKQKRSEATLQDLDGGASSKQPLHSTLKECISPNAVSVIQKQKMESTYAVSVETESGFATSNDRSEVDRTDNGGVLFTTSSKVTSQMLRSNIQGIIGPEKLVTALDLISQLDLSNDDFKQLWTVCQVVGIEHSWLLIHLMEIVQGEK